MKKYLTLILLGSTMVSCSDFLNLQPEYQINEVSFYKSAKDFETALVGNYAGLQALYNTAIVNIGDLSTDNAEIRWTSPTVAETELDEMNPTPSNDFLNTVWSTSFATIARSNNILSRLDDVTMTEAQKNQFKGESLFLRAFSYFNLVRLFGNVPHCGCDFPKP